MIDNLRRTGRTTRDIRECCVGTPYDRSVYVAPFHAFDYLRQVLFNLGRQDIELRTPEGVAQNKLIGLVCYVCVDHCVWEEQDHVANYHLLKALQYTHRPVGPKVQCTTQQDILGRYPGPDAVDCRDYPQDRHYVERASNTEWPTTRPEIEVSTDLVPTDLPAEANCMGMLQSRRYRRNQYRTTYPAAGNCPEHTIIRRVWKLL